MSDNLYLARPTFFVAAFGMVLEIALYRRQEHHHVGGLFFLLTSSVFSMIITRPRRGPP